MKQLVINKRFNSREIILDKYLSEVAKIPKISTQEEKALAIQIKRGDKKALETLVNANLRFVISVAKQYQDHGLPLNDLINDGNLGLIRAAKKFDGTRGFKFISYAVWWIRQSIMASLSETARVVRLPLNKISSTSKIVRTSSKLEQELEREPDVEEIAEMLEISTTEVINGINHRSNRNVSLDAPTIEGEDTTLLDLFPSTDPSPDEFMMDESLKFQVDAILATLPKVDREIICCYYGLKGFQRSGLDVICQKTGLTMERLRQRKDIAFRKLKKLTVFC